MTKQPTFRPFAGFLVCMFVVLWALTMGVPSCSLEQGSTCSHVCDDDEEEGCEEPCGFECAQLFDEDEDEWVDDHLEHNRYYGSPSVRVGSKGHHRGYYQGGKNH